MARRPKTQMVDQKNFLRSVRFTVMTFGLDAFVRELRQNQPVIVLRLGDPRHQSFNRFPWREPYSGPIEPDRKADRHRDDKESGNF